MSYRADDDASRAKIERLEGELADAQAKIERLEGKSGGALAQGLRPNGLLGAPGAIHLVRELDYELTDEGYEAIAAVVRQRLGVQVSQVGRSLHAGPLTVTRKEGKTVVRISAEWDVLAAGLFAVGGMAGLFGTGVTIGCLHDFAHLSMPAILLNVAWVAPLLAASAALGLRRRVRRTALQNVERYRGLFETALLLAEKYAVRPQVRVAADEAQQQEEEAAAEAAEPAERASGRR